MLHFFEVSALGREPLKALESVISLLHGRFKGEKSPIGVSFPDYICDKKFQNIGSRLRLVGKPHDLIEMRNHPVLKALESKGLINPSGIQEVPSHAVPVRFVRDRAHDHIRDKEKTYGSSVLPEVSAKARRRLPHLRRMSQTNFQPYFIFIRKEQADNHDSGTYSTFGLSSNGSTVPYWE